MGKEWRFSKDNEQGGKKVTIDDLDALVEQRRSIRGDDEERQVSDEMRPLGALRRRRPGKVLGE